MMIEEKLAKFKGKIDPIIEGYLEQKIQKYKKIFPESLLLIEQIKDLTLAGGDRIRPALFYYGFRLIRKPDALQEKELLRLSTALEIFHSFALIHDDILDNSLLRRGRKTVNKYFDSQFGKPWGDKLAILVGDLAEIFSQEIFQSPLFKDQLSFAWQMFYTLKEEMIIGEYMDTILPLDTAMPGEEKIKNMLCFKSGYYSIQKPLLMGAILAEGSKEQYTLLANVGYNLGLAFQIRDDILGIFGKQKKIGKSVVSDIIDGKRTLLIVETLKKLRNAKERKKFLEHFGRKNISMADVLYLKKMIKKTGAVSYCQRECERLVLEAKSMLGKAKFRHEAQVFLTNFSNFIISREY